MTRIKIVADSVADIPADLREKWDITIIPTYVNYGGQSYADDGIELDRTAFYNALPNMDDFPTTSAPPPGVAEDVLLRAIEGYDHIVAIHVPERYSTTINVVRLGAQKLPDDRITILDGQTLTAGLGLEAIMAAEVAAQTGDVDAVVDVVKRVRQHVTIYAAIATMTYMRRSGRVNSVVSAVGSLLQIKPVIRVYQGDIEPIHRIRTFGRAVDKLREMIIEKAPFDHLVMLHIQNEAEARALLADLGNLAPPDTTVMEVGPTLGSFIGPGSVGALILPKGW